MKASVLNAFAAASILTLTGCATGINVPGLPTAEPTPEPVYVTAPLTGIQYDEGTPQALQLSKPSVACKIDNGSEASRPQAGLNSTDIVFDEMVEGGLTRLVAIWHSKQPDAIGPVRSIRPMDPDIISPFGGIVCYSGGQWVFVKAMEAAPIFNASETSEQGKGTFSRSKDRIAPHNVIVNVQKLATDHPELTPPPAQFSFATDLASSSVVKSASAIRVKNFTVNFPQASAQWIPSVDGQIWQRVQDGKIHTDKLDGEQIHAVNIVVMEVAEDRSYKDGKYGNVPKAVMIGTGDAWVFSGGKYIEATWRKSAATSPIVLTDLAGQPVLLAPGNSWVELMPKALEGKLNINKVAVASRSPSATAKK